MVTGFPLASVTIWLFAFSTGSSAAQEGERAVEARGLLFWSLSRRTPHAEANGVGAVRNRSVVLQLEMVGQVVRVADAVAAGR